jgi:hypothetical protein
VNTASASEHKRSLPARYRTLANGGCLHNSCEGVERIIPNPSFKLSHYPTEARREGQLAESGFLGC